MDPRPSCNVKVTRLLEKFLKGKKQNPETDNIAAENVHQLVGCVKSFCEKKNWDVGPYADNQGRYTLEVLNRQGGYMFSVDIIYGKFSAMGLDGKPVKVFNVTVKLPTLDNVDSEYHCSRCQKPVMSL